MLIKLNLILSLEIEILFICFLLKLASFSSVLGEPSGKGGFDTSLGFCLDEYEEVITENDLIENGYYVCPNCPRRLLFIVLIDRLVKPNQRRLQNE